ncbi:hypothetical protein PSEUDO8BK_40938 [Pseudomonas sp. 8BK]|nr:hypothetical protein PSEUDO8BK_40938 [Pseudomonas sp. 8BK]
MGCEPRGDKSGGIAQLGERLHGMQEVNGSIPFISTNFAVVTTATGQRKAGLVFRRFRPLRLVA